MDQHPLLRTGLVIKCKLRCSNYSERPAMDLRLKEVTWIRLLSLLLWTVLMMLKRIITQLIEIVETRVFDVSGQEGRERKREKRSEEVTLLPPLSDELVLSRIWPRLHQRVNVSLLWRLRRVNRAWRKKVGATLEWSALEIVRVDTPGLTRYLEKRGERRPSLRERVESELKSLAVLLSEQPSDFVFQLLPYAENEIDVETTGAGDELSSSSCTPRVITGCACNWVDFGQFEGFQNRYREEYNWSEEEGIEAYASSSEGSLRAHYPRHSLRVLHS